MKKKIIALLLAVLAASSYSQQTSYRPMMASWDLDDTDDNSCIAAPIFPAARIKTTGSSTTTATLTANTLPFISASVGDIIYANVVGTNSATQGPKTGRVITAKASGDSITVDAAWDLGTLGQGFELWKVTCADTTANTGWTNVKGNKISQAYMSIDQMVVSAGGIAVKLEAAYGELTDSFLSVYNVWPGTVTNADICGVGTWTAGYCVYTSASDAKAVVTLTDVVNPTGLRWVFQISDTDDDSTPASENEKITAGLVEVK